MAFSCNPSEREVDKFLIYLRVHSAQRKYMETNTLELLNKFLTDKAITVSVLAKRMGWKIYYTESLLGGFKEITPDTAWKLATAMKLGQREREALMASVKQQA